MNKAQLLADFNDEHLRDLNRLVFAAEAIECPEIPTWPAWKESPANAETIETEDPAELRALAVAWQDWASKLDDILQELNFEGLGEEISKLRTKAKRARLALIALEAYDPALVLLDGRGVR